MRQTSPGGYWTSPLVLTAPPLSSTQVNKQLLTGQPLHQATVALYVVKLHLGTTFRSRPKREEIRNSFILLKELVHVNPVVILIGRWQCKYQVIRRPGDGQTFDFACVCVRASQGWRDGVLSKTAALYMQIRGCRSPLQQQDPPMLKEQHCAGGAGAVGD